MHRFDWNDLQAFLAVVRAGRLTTAARLLDIDHSTLSRRIAGLEASLGQTLFDRRSTGYVLTAEGERLVIDAEAMESLAIGMRARSDTGSGGLTGSVRLGVPEGFGTYFLAPKLATLAREHPQLEIELIANPRNFSLTKREADVAVAMSRPEQGHLHAYKLTDYEVGLYASRSYLDQHGPVYSRAELTQRTWVGYVDDLMWTRELDYMKHVSPGMVPRIRISNVICQMTAVMGGVGLGMLPVFMARNERSLVRLLSHDVRLSRSYWLVTHTDSRKLARVRAVVDHVREQSEAAGAAFWEDTTLGPAPRHEQTSV